MQNLHSCAQLPAPCFTNCGAGANLLFDDARKVRVSSLGCGTATMCHAVWLASGGMLAPRQRLHAMELQPCAAAATLPAVLCR